MAFALSKIPSFRANSALLFVLPTATLPVFKTPQKPTSQINRTSCNFGSMDTQTHSSPSIPSPLSPASTVGEGYRWKPMCLYYTQGKCSMMNDPMHLEKFNHDCSRDLQVTAVDCQRKKPQDFDFFLVLDLEGKVEILEFPVLMIDAKTMAIVDLFHRFVRPSVMSEQRINEYIFNKYGKLGIDRIWHDTALPFSEVLQQFEAWLTQHCLWERKLNRTLNRAAFVTCGNWDVKTKLPQQCKVSKVKLPPYFMEWINLKDVFQNFYRPNKEARGMRTMMDQLKIPMLGSHHLGVDDTKNIARVLLRMLADGAVMPITAWRNPDSPENVSFLYKNLIR